ncbi:SDR family oxidoreductase [Mycolicibacterium rufum]|uniref:SDR family oxidoreductase n=1 Tax=Mycolicibacterium rufum TaxID=318424 RepID=A0A9X2YHX2_9MYCO|nr:SDR family oxidoreductase [Mycolicibacterium rufum]KGI66531.1 short-chain dehydrogenase [Mycolicibacterium rufum]MCV7073819.1 SDR family oxidoreductase [Mycolicibacterium rufum]ULP37298.1 SDR family oxidoreductase [Mycolicibacterium rufum]
MTDLTGKAYLVIGASGALGSRIARLLADRGAGLTVTGRDADALAAIGDVHAVTADLRDPDAARTVVEAAREHHGRLDGVVIAAGVVAFGPLTDIDDDTVDDLVLVDFLAPLRVVRAALPVIEQGGVILGISAVVAERPMPNMAVYSAVKAATAALFTAARTEARRRKIRVVDVRPPHTETGLAGRAIAGDPPRLPTGLEPDAVAERIVAALLGDETDVPSTDFS